MKAKLGLLIVPLFLINAASAAVVTINGPSNIVPGQSFDVNITIDPGGVDVAGAQTNIRFNPLILRVNSIVEGSTLFRDGGRLNTFFHNGTIDNTLGRVINIYSAIIGPYNVSAAGTFITVNMTAIGPGSSEISLYTVKISDPNGNYVSRTVVNATVGSCDCDVNQDGFIDIFDAKLIKNVLDGDPTPCPRCRVLGNNNVTVFDIVAVIENVD